MTGNQSYNIGQKHNKIDINSIKIGVKATDLNLQDEALSLFNSADKNNNHKLDNNTEISLFKTSANTYNNNIRRQALLSYNYNDSDFTFTSASSAYLKSGISKAEKIAYERMSKQEKISFLRNKGYYRDDLNPNVCASDNTRINTPTVQRARANVKIAEEKTHEKRVSSVEKELAKTFTPAQKKNMKVVVSRMQSNYKEAQASFDQQMKKDGWAADTADAISHLWNNKVICATGNTADMVRSDLAAYQKQTKALNQGITDGSFERKFQNTFGVQYNPTNIKKYEQTKKEYEQMFAQAHAYDAFTTAMKSSMDKIKTLETQLKREEDLAKAGRGSGLDYTTPKLNAAKIEFVNKMQDILGIKSNQPYQTHNLQDFDEYLKLYNEVNQTLLKEKNEKEPKLKAKSDELSNARKKAYGTSNDIVARVENYNASQDTGAACVKFVAGVALNALGPSSVIGSLVYGAATAAAMDVADAATNGIDNDFDIKNTAVNTVLGGLFGATNQAIVNKYAGGVASKILSSASGQTVSKSVGSKLTGFVVKEIISKEGVKLPAYAVEGVTKTVVQNMAGIKTGKETTASQLSQEDLQNAMAVVSESMMFLAAAKDNGKIKQNATQGEMVTLLNEHISSSMQNNKNFNIWLNNNQKQFQQLLNQLVQNELPKLNGQMKVK